MPIQKALYGGLLVLILALVIVAINQPKSITGAVVGTVGTTPTPELIVAHDNIVKHFDFKENCFATLSGTVFSQYSEAADVEIRCEVINPSYGIIGTGAQQLGNIAGNTRIKYKLNAGVDCELAGEEATFRCLATCRNC